MNGAHAYTIWRYKNGELSETDDSIATESTLAIVINGKRAVSLSYTPCAVKEFVTGFLFTQGIITRPGDIISFEYDREKDTATLVLDDSLKEISFFDKQVVSGCGAGVILSPFSRHASLLEKEPSPVTAHIGVLLEKMKEFQKKPSLFKETGAVHSAGVLMNGCFDIFYEDIGRHNAVDKVIGKAIMEGTDLKEAVMFVSGRISSDIVLKCAAPGIGITVSGSAPTSAALSLADQLHITIIGFMRATRCNIYTHKERIKT